MAPNTTTASGMTRQYHVQDNTVVGQLSAPITGRDSKPGPTIEKYRLDREGDDDETEKERRFEQVGHLYKEHLTKSKDARGMHKWYETEMSILADEKKRLPKRLAEIEKEKEELSARYEEVLKNEAIFVGKYKAEADQGKKDKALKERYEQYMDIQIEELVVETEAGGMDGVEGGVQ